MQDTRATRILRDITAVLVVAIFMFPLFWWALTSFKPQSAIFNKDEVVFFDFKPTLVNYGVTLLGKSRSEIAIESGNTFGVGGGSSYDSRQTILDSIIVAVGSTALTIFLGVIAAYALSRIKFRGRQAYLNWILSQRFMPPIAIIVRFQIFRKVVLPLVTGGMAATAVLCFIFSWTEFLLSLFLTNTIRTLPVKISTFVTSTGSEWGFISALGTSAVVPSFIFILLVQKQLVRGLTLGSLKD
ncbi:MAG: carbohydrate ABC transporter permease [Bradyrhizobium sp.]|nr:carbohydrate ABC transporter permease [Bradyrhizobium sp.]